MDSLEEPFSNFISLPYDDVFDSACLLGPNSSNPGPK